MTSDQKFRFDPNRHNRRSIRLKGYDYSLAGFYFITICAYQRRSLFGQVIDGEMVLNSAGEIVHHHWMNLKQQHPHIMLDEFIVMPNHFHGILGLDGRSRSLSEIIRGFKTFSARRINQIYKAKGTSVWQRNYYEHIIRNAISHQKIRHYIQNNPQSWQVDQLHPDIPSDG